MEQLTILLPLVLCLSVLHLIQGFLQPPLPEGVKNELPFVSNGIDPGQPLYLTPLIEQGKYDEAQRASLVGYLDGTGLKSYAGLITVNKTYNSNMFFWFFPSQKDPMNDPVLLWLQGGPGRSSLFGLFVEIGPFSVDKKIKLVNRNVTWHKQYSVLYIDNPVGGGFSFTENDKGYSTNQVEVGINLYSCLTQFFMAFYQYQKNDFYVTGESYAGKFIPAISYRIYLENPTAKVKINFKGLAMGNSWTDPQTMIPSYASFLYSLGLLDENQRAYFQNTADKAVADIIDEKYMDAFYTFQSLLGGDLFASYFYKCTGMKYYYNFMLTEGPSDFYYHATYLTQPEVRRALHVGNLTYSISNDKAYHSMWPDFMHTVKPWVATLLDNNIKVMFYNGQLDIMVPGQVTEAILPTIKWSGQDKYLNVTRLIWKVMPHHKDIAGFVRQADNLYQVIVRGAGHILPYDQPERGLDMITRFVENLSFS